MSIRDGLAPSRPEDEAAREPHQRDRPQRNGVRQVLEDERVEERHEPCGRDGIRRCVKRLANATAPATVAAASSE